MEIEIHCPVHGEKETLDLPDSYENFEGQVTCPVPVGNRSQGAALKIKIVDGKLVSLERG